MTILSLMQIPVTAPHSWLSVLFIRWPADTVVTIQSGIVWL
jgi:hypothetical protein